MTSVLATAKAVPGSVPQRADRHCDRLSLKDYDGGIKLRLTVTVPCQSARCAQSLSVVVSQGGVSVTRERIKGTTDLWSFSSGKT